MLHGCLRVRTDWTNLTESRLVEPCSLTSLSFNIPLDSIIYTYRPIVLAVRWDICQLGKSDDRLGNCLIYRHQIGESFIPIKKSEIGPGRCTSITRDWESLLSIVPTFTVLDPSELGWPCHEEIVPKGWSIILCIVQCKVSKLAKTNFVLCLNIWCTSSNERKASGDQWPRAKLNTWTKNADGAV